uniref:Uncharacterized protein n=1 Tax=Talaromyces marneffei PM1 TaxID=1077442 RepID=A0A093XM75_TALMA
MDDPSLDAVPQLHHTAYYWKDVCSSVGLTRMREPERGSSTHRVFENEDRIIGRIIA